MTGKHQNEMNMKTIDTMSRHFKFLCALSEEKSCIDNIEV